VFARRVEVTAEPSRAMDLARHVLVREGGISGGRDTLAVYAHDPLRPAPALRYEDEALALGRTYTYLLYAEDLAGNRSEAARAEVAFLDAQAPPPPRLPRVASDGGALTLSWLASAAGDVAGYHVYRAPAPGAKGEQLTAILATDLTWSGAEVPGWYTVRAVDTSGNLSEASVPVRVE
jgi:hypothetical protein